MRQHTVFAEIAERRMILLKVYPGLASADDSRPTQGRSSEWLQLGLH